MSSDKISVLKTRVENNINKRQMSIQLAAIVVSGIIGMWFVDNFLKLILIPIGFYYAYVFLSNYIVLDRKIENLINEMEKEL